MVEERLQCSSACNHTAFTVRFWRNARSSTSDQVPVSFCSLMTNRCPNSVVDDVPFQHQQTWMLGANAFVPPCGAGGGASPELHSALGGVCVCVCKYIFLFRLHICDFQYISTVATPTKETAVTGVTEWMDRCLAQVSTEHRSESPWICNLNESACRESGRESAQQFVIFGAGTK